LVYSENRMKRIYTLSGHNTDTCNVKAGVYLQFRNICFPGLLSKLELTMYNSGQCRLESELLVPMLCRKICVLVMTFIQTLSLIITISRGTVPVYIEPHVCGEARFGKR
jgi:hypothetical protein